MLDVASSSSFCTLNAPLASSMHVIECMHMRPTVVDEKVFCIHAGLSPDLNTPDQIKRIMRPTDVPDAGKPMFRVAPRVCARRSGR